MDTTLVNVTNIKELGGQSFYGVSLDALVSAIIAILVFGLGLFFTKKHQIIQKYYHLEDVESYLYALFSEISGGVKERIKSFESLVEQLGKKEQADIKMEYTSDYSLEFIKEISWIDYYSVFSKLKTNKHKNSITIFKNINKCVAVRGMGE